MLARTRRARSRSMARFFAIRISQVAGDPQQRVVGFGARPHAHEGLLQHFFRVGRAAQNADDDAIGQTAVPVVEICQRGFVTRRDALKETGVDLRAAGFHDGTTWHSARERHKLGLL